METDRSFEEREAINRGVVMALNEASTNWGVKVMHYEIKELTLPKDSLQAMQRQITTERERRALIASSEGRMQERSTSRPASATRRSSSRKAKFRRRSTSLRVRPKRPT